MPYQTVNGFQIHYVERGTGRPLVLVHGFPLDHTMWQGQVDELAKQYRLIAPDLRGFGRSTVTDGPVASRTVTMAQYADDLAALLDSLAIQEPVTICGLSMGGYIAWQFWRKYAGRLAGLILCDTRASADSAEAARQRGVAAEQVLSQGVGQLVDSMTARLFAAETLKTQPSVVASTRETMLRTAPAAIAAALRGMAERPDMSAELPKIECPTLVVCGEQDVISPATEMRGIASAIPNAQLVLVPDAGHMAPLEQPAIVNRSIQTFLASL